MIPLIWHYVKAFFFDQNAAKRFLVGLGSLAASMITAVLVFGLPTIATWDRKTLLQHIAFALLTTLATMLPGPAIAKPGDNKLVEIKPPRGFVQFAVLAGIVCGALQALILGLAFNSLGLTSHGWMLLIIPTSAWYGYAVWKSVR